MVVVGGSEAPIMPVGLGGFVACRALSTRNDEPEKASRCAGWSQTHTRGCGSAEDFVLCFFAECFISATGYAHAS